MSDVYANSITGLRNAELALDRAARNIASGRNISQQTESPSDTVQISPAGQAASAGINLTPVDYAAELAVAQQAAIAAKANFKALAMQLERERDSLDLFV